MQPLIPSRLKALDAAINTLTEIDAAIAAAEKDYLEKAEKLSASRQKAAKELTASIDENLALLNLANAAFSVRFKDGRRQPQSQRHGRYRLFILPQSGARSKAAA